MKPSCGTPSSKNFLQSSTRACKSRPFGNPASDVSAARQIAAWADSLLESLNQTTFDAAKAAIARSARQDGWREHPGLRFARQIAWAFRVIYRESVPMEKRDPVIEHVLADLETELALNLKSAGEQVPIEKTLQDRLRVVARFDPEYFQAHFAIIAERLTGTRKAREL